MTVPSGPAAFLRSALFGLCLAAAMALAAPASFAATYDSAPEDEGAPTPPPSLSELENVPRVNKPAKDADTGMPFDIREDAIKEAALSYGARGGLAWRTYYIRQSLDERATYLDKVFDFSQLLIPAPSGLLIEPPVISEAENAMIIDAGGVTAAVADRVYNMNANARFVSTARSWRNYLERDWGDVTPPPDILRPATDEERKIWVKLVREGWERGVEQADDIFQDDLNQLKAEHQGMVRYRMLLSQGMITPPYALQTDRGVTASGKAMRVGDRAVQITGMPEFVPGTETWQPASR